MESPRDIKFPAKMYWGLKVVKELSPDGEIYLYADIVIEKDGNLTFLYQDKEGTFIPGFAVAKGHWICYFAASLIDGAPCKVEHWKGVKSEKTEE